jgi:type 1 glutamine amidotransferase
MNGCGDTLMKNTTRKTARAATVRVLIVIDSKGHDAKHFAELMQELIPTEAKATMELGFSFQFTVNTPDDYRVFTKGPTLLADHDVLLWQTTGGHLAQEEQAGLIAYVSAGGGFVGVHCAADSFVQHDNWDYWRLIGAQFRTHPASGDVVGRIAVADHPTMQGLPNPIVIPDEKYICAWHPNPIGGPLVKLVYAKWLNRPWAFEVQPGGPDDELCITHCKDVGKGRVFWTGYGHDSMAWYHPDFINMVGNALAWAAKKL